MFHVTCGFFFTSQTQKPYFHTIFAFKYFASFCLHKERRYEGNTHGIYLTQTKLPEKNQDTI